MSPDAVSALQAVPFRVSNPELIPAKRYYDAGFFELENRKLWPRVWQMACRLEEIPEVGDYVEYALLERSVIVVRAEAGVKAFHNVCRHRGMKLVEGPGNCEVKGFNCPFHGWRYDSNGENTFILGPQVFNEDLIRKADIHLKPCRVEVWGGCAFINFDDDAPPLTEAIGPLARSLEARHVEKMRTEWWYASVVPTNWKVAVEAFVEMYHLMRTHPELHALTRVFGGDLGDQARVDPASKVSGRQVVGRAIDYLANLSDGMGGLVHKTEVAVVERLRDMEVPDDPNLALRAFYERAQDEITREGRARGLPIFDLKAVAAEHPTQGNEFIFPNFFLLPLLGSMASYRIRPLTAETCLFEIWSLVLLPEGEPHQSPKQPTFLAFDSPDYPLIPRQDYENLPKQQAGLRSGAIEHQRLSHIHEGEISNFERLIDGYLADLDYGRLVAAGHAVNGGSFHPIKDLGF